MESKFKRKGKIKKFYEIEFNGNKNNFDRISAESAKEAKEKMQKLYPKEKISKVTEL